VEVKEVMAVMTGSSPAADLRETRPSTGRRPHFSPEHGYHTRMTTRTTDSAAEVDVHVSNAQDNDRKGELNAKLDGDSAVESAGSSESSHFDESNPLYRARLDKLHRWREQFGITGYGERVESLNALAEARAMFDQAAHDQYDAAKAAAGESGAAMTAPDPRPRARVAGRCMQSRVMGKLVFLSLRDHSGDLQISISKSDLSADEFALASKLDYGDIVFAEGPMGMTRKGEICMWADRFELECKSLVPPPEKYHGLQDVELRSRHRYIDMYANPETMRVFQARSRAMSLTRRFMDARDYLEVETPMMQPIAGGAAARPFITHHNTLDMPLYMRIAPELYLKRLLVGGMPRVYEINRNFRNEGTDRSHNPEFTMMEVYEAFGDCWTMLELTESLVFALAQDARANPVDADVEPVRDDPAPTLPFGDLVINYARPFPRISYGELFEQAWGFPMTDEDNVREAAKKRRIERADVIDHWLLVNELFELEAEHRIDPARPTFVYDFPSAISPLTRPYPDRPHLSMRWEVFIAGMECANSYTELNDPIVQRAKFAEQLTGADDEASTFRTMDEDFIHALRVGMPPAGGLGVGMDRLVMLMTNRQTIRDVILFPLLKPE
jgi:lysyl-tRNA synthetase class 2